jgi:hypothetical protein
LFEILKRGKVENKKSSFCLKKKFKKEKKISSFDLKKGGGKKKHQTKKSSCSLLFLNQCSIEFQPKPNSY